jgi:hypothetical protein
MDLYFPNIITGSGYFSGSFIGDGSQLSGVTSYTNTDTLNYINSIGVLSGSLPANIISGSGTDSYIPKYIGSKYIGSSTIQQVGDNVRVTGSLQITGSVLAETYLASKIFYRNAVTISFNYTVPANENAMSAGDIYIKSGSTVTVNGNWSIV